MNSRTVTVAALLGGISLTVVGGWSVAPRDARAQDIPAPRPKSVILRVGDPAVLQGLPGVRVVVEDMTDAGTRLGLSREKIQALIEPKLRQAGIRVIEPAEAASAPDARVLYVNVNVGNPVYAVRVEVQESVQLLRPSPTLLVGVPVWRRNAAGNVLGDPEPVLAAVAAKVDELCADYRAANPR